MGHIGLEEARQRGLVQGTAANRGLELNLDWQGLPVVISHLS
jgi:hypothetical protein